MKERTQTSDKKMSSEAIAVMLMFAAIPLIAFIKWNYDDHVLLGAVASIILAASAIMLRQEIDKKKAVGSSEEGAREQGATEQAKRYEGAQEVTH